MVHPVEIVEYDERYRCMFVAYLRGKACSVVSLAATALLDCLLLALFIPGSAAALLYRTPEGTLKDNCVVWHDGTFHPRKGNSACLTRSHRDTKSVMANGSDIHSCS